VGGAEEPGLRFPAVARLELDQLLEQLIERARDVQATQGRLRGLLRANMEITQGVDLENVLQHVVGAARRLVHARYAALGVIDQGRLVRFIHDGMDTELVARIGDLPQGKGVLGVLIDDPRPVRVRDIGEHERSVGFPAHHPPMRSFLGVPIRIQDRIFGNLYLTGKEDGEEFGADDEELVTALAAAAGLAIENATLFAKASRRQAWQAATVEVANRTLTAASTEEAVRHLVAQAVAASGADGATFVTPTDDPAELRILVATGTLAGWEGDRLPADGTVSGVVIAERRAMLLSDPGSDPRMSAFRRLRPDMGPTLAAPVIGESDVIGVVTVARSVGRGMFDATDLDMIAGFGVQAALAIEMAEVRRDNEQLHRLDDRRQIAEDLQQGVIRRLSELSMTLPGIAARVASPAVHDLIEQRITEVDDIIRDFRAAVFGLHHPIDDRPTDPD
jgi:two-component system, NarL family, sensor histidine kinase DevS